MVNELKMRIGNGHQLGLHRSVLTCLGNPKYLMFFVDNTNKSILLGVGDESNHFTFAVPESCYTHRYSFRLNNKSLSMALLRAIGAENCNNLKLSGKFIPELKMVAFKAIGEEI